MIQREYGGYVLPSASANLSNDVTHWLGQRVSDARTELKLMFTPWVHTHPCSNHGVLKALCRPHKCELVI